MRRKDEYANIGLGLANRLDHAEAIQIWQMQVEQHKVWPGFGHERHRAPSVLRFADDVMPQIVDADVPQHLAEHQMIFDDYNPHSPRFEGAIVRVQALCTAWQRDRTSAPLIAPRAPARYASVPPQEKRSRGQNPGGHAKTLDPPRETETLSPPIFALLVYRLGQEILNLQSGVRFPVGAPSSQVNAKFGTEGTEAGQTKVCSSEAAGAVTRCHRKGFNAPQVPRSR